MAFAARQPLRIGCEVTDGSQGFATALERRDVGVPDFRHHLVIDGAGPGCHHQNGLFDERRFLGGGAQHLAVKRISDVGAIPMKALEHSDDVNGRVGGNGADGAAHAVLVAAGNIEANSDIDGITRPHVRRKMKHALQGGQRFRRECRQCHAVLDTLIGYGAEFTARSTQHAHAERRRPHGPRRRQFHRLRQLVEIVDEYEISLAQSLPVNGPRPDHRTGMPARDRTTLLG